MFPLLTPNSRQITPQVSSKKRSGNASAEASLAKKKKKVQAKDLPARSLCSSNAKTSAKVCESLVVVLEEKEPVTPAEKGGWALMPALASSDEGSEFKGENAAEHLRRKGTLSMDPVEEEIPLVVQPEDEVAETAAPQ